MGLRNRLLPAQTKGSRTPFFMVVAYGDTEATYRLFSELIPRLGLDQPVYGFQARWLDGHSKGYSSIEEAALEFLADLQAVQPKGPYQLGGECIGGVIALVMAQELIRRGEEVRSLVMFDTYRSNILRSLAFELDNGWRRAKHIIDTIRQIIGASHRSRRELMRDVARRKLGNDDSKTREELVAKFRTNFVRTVFRHRPKQYPGRITLIVNEKQYRSDKSMGWNGVASGGLEIYSTPGNHWTRYSSHGEQIARRLIDCLDRNSPPITQ